MYVEERDISINKIIVDEKMWHEWGKVMEKSELEFKNLTEEFSLK